MGRHGENIRKRKDGRWEARLIQGYDLNGKANYRYLYGKTYLEAKGKKQAAVAELRAGKARSAALRKITFGQLTREWLEGKRGRVKESTWANYANAVERHLMPELGGIYVTALTADFLEQFLLRKLNQGRLDGRGGLSAKTVADLRSLLKLILQYAQSKGFAGMGDFHLPAPAGRPPKIQTLTKREQEKLERVLFSDPKPLHLGILIALYAGLRIGEVCALQWGDFRFEEGTVSVSKTLLRIQDPQPGAKAKTKVVIDLPKTPSSNRVIPLPDFILSYYKMNRRGKDCYLLTGTERFMEPRACLERYKRVLRLAGVGEHNFHTLRHTFATRCVENGFDIKSLSEIMGHSSVTVTMQRYVHPSMELKREQMNKLSTMAICGQNCGRFASSDA